MQADYIHITITDGQLALRDQLKEYMDRGELLMGYSFLEYFINTYDTDDSGGKANMEHKEGGYGHPCNERVAYKEGCSRDNQCQIICWDTRLCLTLLGSSFPETMTASFRKCTQHAYLHCSSFGKALES